MSAAPVLLQKLLEEAGGPAERGYVLVLDGEGLEELPDTITTPQAGYSVHRVRSELGLRHLLWQSKGAPLIAVMPEDVAQRIQKSPDLLRRAQNQRIHALTTNDVLEVVLRVRVVGADPEYMQRLALDNLGRLSVALARRTLPTVVDRQLLTELLLDVSVGERMRAQSPAQLLAGWVLDPPHWTENVRHLVQGALPTLHDMEGRLLAWAIADPDVRLRQLVIHGAVLTVDEPDIPKQAWGPLWKAAAEVPIKTDHRVVRRAAARLAEETLVVLGDQAMELLEAADAIGRETLRPAEIQTSHVLPLAFAVRCHALAQQAALGHAIEAADLAWLAAHRAARLHKGDLAVLEAMGRLTRYLDRPAPAPSLVLDQVVEYQAHGAFADIAVLQLRRALAGSALYHREAHALLALVRARRDADNRRFAESLARAYEPALHTDGLTPLHRLWKRTIAPVWQQDPRARIFLVVLDGCSYPIFLELLQALAQDGAFPIGARADADGRVAGLPALSPLPTITSHARGAIFLGELPNDPLVAETVFHDQDEARTDKARFKQNQALGQRTRKLFLKGDLTDGGQALLAALEGELDVVATVFNAVDDHIGSSDTGSIRRLLPEDILAFKPALRAALKAGRRVLVTADHGHSAYVDNSLRVGNGKAPRFVALGPTDPVPEGFLEIDVGGLGGPPERRAFAYRSGVYLGGAQVGFHGGASLEEMVVPLAWLSHDGLPASEPPWWFGAGALLEPSAVVRIQPPLVTPLMTITPLPTAVVTQPQLSLVSDRSAALPLPASLLAGLAAEERLVLVLLQENGVARTTELAERLKKNPARLQGFMRKLRRTLSDAGCVLFTDEVHASGETLYRWKANG